MLKPQIHSPPFDFSPPQWMRPAMVQTGLASQKFRKKAASQVIANAKTHILDCGDGVRLQGSLTRHPNSTGLFVFLHGWEGSENSTYVLSSSRFVYDQGYSVFRLNFRDHGDTHHLNAGIFHSVLFDEVDCAVRQVADMAEDQKVYLAGFSLGGNFALRIARGLQAKPVSNLAHIFAISPVIDPEASSPIVDQNPLIRRYFYKKWTTSMRKKQMAFPDAYDFTDIMKQKTVMGMTDVFLKQFSDFETPNHYFRSYRIDRDDLAESSVPVSMIMAEDDPVINAFDMMALNISPCVTRIMLKYGGHNGFFQSLTGPTWYDDYISQTLQADY